MGYLTDKLKDYFHNQAIRNNPQYRSQYEADRISDVIGELYGSPGTEEEFTGPPLLPGHTGTRMTQGTGLYDQSVSPRERFMTFSKGLMESGIPTLQKQGQSAIASLQNQLMNLTGSDSGISGDSGVSWEEWQNMSPLEQAMYTMHRGDPLPSDVTKVTLGMQDPNFASKLHEVKSVGQKYIKRGDDYYDPYTDEKVDRRVAEGVMEKTNADYVAKRMNNFSGHWNRAENFISDLDRTKNALDNLKDLTGKTTTGFAAILKFIPYTKASYWDSVKRMIISNIALQEMARLKAESPSGATGFGSLSEAELQVLTDRLNTLKQTDDPKYIKKLAGEIYDSLDEMKFKAIRAQRQDLEWAKRINEKWGNRYDDTVFFDLYDSRLDRRSDYLDEYQEKHPGAVYDWMDKEGNVVTRKERKDTEQDDATEIDW